MSSSDALAWVTSFPSFLFSGSQGPRWEDSVHLHPCLVLFPPPTLQSMQTGLRPPTLPSEALFWPGSSFPSLGHPLLSPALVPARLPHLPVLDSATSVS